MHLAEMLYVSVYFEDTMHVTESDTESDASKTDASGVPRAS